MRVSLPDLPDIDWQHHGRTIQSDIGLQVNGLIVHLYIGRLSVMWNRKDKTCLLGRPEDEEPLFSLLRTPGTTSTSFVRPAAGRPPGPGAQTSAALSEIEAGTLDTAQLLSLLDHTLTHWLLNRDPECKWCR